MTCPVNLDVTCFDEIQPLIDAQVLAYQGGLGSLITTACNMNFIIEASEVSFEWVVYQCCQHIVVF